MKKILIILTPVFLITLFFIGSWWYKDAQTNNQYIEKSILATAHSPSLGSKDAKVVLVEFFDPACETCAQFAPLVKEFLKKYEPNLRLVLRYATFHENSETVVKMLEATRAQGKYWEALEAVLAYQRAWTANHVAYPSRVWPILEHVGVDVEALKIEMKSSKIEEIIAKDMADAKASGATKTPSFFVNGKALEEFGYKPLVKLIEEAL